MRGVRFADEFLAFFAAEVEEQSAFAFVLSKRNIARLFFVVPNGVACFFCNCRAGFCNACTEKPCSRNGQRVVFADAAMVGSVKEFLRSSEFAFGEFYLPGGAPLESGFILVVAGVGYIDDCRIAVIEDSPAGDGGTLDIQFYAVCPFCVQVADVKFGCAADAFGLGTECNAFSIGRNIRVIYFDGIMNLFYG